MNRTLLSVCFFLSVFTSLQAETILRGIITYQNTGNRVSAIQVTARGSSPTITKANSNTEGTFRLIFPTKKPGDVVKLNITNRQYDLVNHPRELEIIIPENPNEKLIRLVVCKKGERDQNAVKYYEISTAYLAKGYEKREAKLNQKIAKLNQRLNNQTNNTEELQQQILSLKLEKQDLYDTYQTKLDKAWILAEGFSRLDLAQTDATFNEAFDLFKTGDIEKATQLLSVDSRRAALDKIYQKEQEIQGEKAKIEAMKSAIVKQEERLVEEERKLQEGKSREIGVLMMSAYFADLNFDNIEKEKSLLEAIRLDSTYTPALIYLSSLYASINRAEEALKYQLQAEKFAEITIEKATIKFEMGSMFANVNLLTPAERYLLEAQTLFDSLSTEYPGTFYKYTAGVCNNLAIIYVSMNRPFQAEKMYLKALEIRRKLAELTPDQFEPEVGYTLNNLGALYSDIGQAQKAEKVLFESLEINKRLAEKDPKKHNLELSKTYNNLGVLYRTNKLQDRSGYYLSLSIQILEELEQKNPGPHKEFLGNSIINIANVYDEINEPQLAEQANLRALAIFEELALLNPAKFTIDVVMIQNNLGLLYHNGDQYNKSLKAYQKGIQEIEVLAQQFPGRFDREYAMLYHNMGLHYNTTAQYEQAKSAYQKAYEIYEGLARTNPVQYEPSMGRVKSILAGVYEKNQEYKQAEQAFQEALALYKPHAEKQPNTFAIKMAETYFIYGEYKERQNQPTEAATLYQSALRYVDLAPKDTYAQKLSNTIVDKLGIEKADPTFTDWYKKVVPYDKELQQESDAKRQLMIQKKIVEIWDKADKKHPNNPRIQSFLSEAYGTLSWYYTLNREFKKGEEAASKGLDSPGSDFLIFANYAVALVYQGQLEEALPIYNMLKNQQFSEDRSFKSIFLEDLDTLEKAGITHPDVAKLRAFLNE